MMSARTVRIGGWLLLLAAVISIVSIVLGFVIPGPAGVNGPSSSVVSIVDIIAGVLFLVSIPVIYLHQRTQMGVMGLIGTIALWLTALLFDVVASIIALITVSSSPASSFSGGPPPALLALFLVGTILELIAGILLGLRIIQTRAFPVLIGWLLILAVVLGGLSFPLQGTLSMVVSTLNTALLFIALGWLGYALATHAPGGVVASVDAAKTSV